jgi:hypothetical protein
MTARPDITDIQVVEPEQAVRPKSSRTGRLGVLLLVLGVIALAVWAALAPLDEGVPTQALVTVDTKRKAVQHIVGGIVRQVLVGEGQQVQEEVWMPNSVQQLRVLDLRHPVVKRLTGPSPVSARQDQDPQARYPIKCESEGQTTLHRWKRYQKRRPPLWPTADGTYRKTRQSPGQRSCK